MTDEQLQKINKLAEDVLRMSRNTLLVNLRFLDSALSMFELFPTDEISVATDGKYLLYNPAHILKRYKNEKEASVRDYLHIVMHCIFRHMYVHTLVNTTCWNLACDIAAEYAIWGLGLKSAKVSREVLMEEVFKELENEHVMITAEKLYRHYMDKNLSPEKLAELRGIFLADDHEIWYMSDSEKAVAFVLPEPGAGNGSTASGDGEGDGNGAGNSVSVSFSASVIEQEWKEISEKLQMDMETFSKDRGRDPGAMLQNLKEINRENTIIPNSLKISPSCTRQ